MDKLVALREARHGYTAVFQSGESLRLSPADLRALPLSVGDAVDVSAYRQNLLLRQYPEALDRAVGLLSVRARSKQEVERRLAERGYLPDTVEMVLYKLERERLLNDEAFAQAWAEGRAARGMGKARLRQELRMKGVESDIADDAINALDDEEMARQAQALAERLLRRLADEPPQNARRKALAAMQRRGYAYGDATKALQSAMAELDASDGWGGETDDV